MLVLDVNKGFFLEVNKSLHVHHSYLSTWRTISEKQSTRLKNVNGSQTEKFKYERP